MPIDFTDHIQYAHPVNVVEVAANMSEEFFNWSGRTIVVLQDKKTARSPIYAPYNLPFVTLKFLACLTIIIPLVFLLLRSYTRSVLLSDSLYGRVKPAGVRQSAEFSHERTVKGAEHTLTLTPLTSLVKTMVGEENAIAVKNMGKIMQHALTLQPGMPPLTTKRLSEEVINSLEQRFSGRERALTLQPGRLPLTTKSFPEETINSLEQRFRDTSYTTVFKSDFNDFKDPDSYHVVFANSRLGGAPFTGGAVQEELLLASVPMYAAFVAAHQDKALPGYSTIYTRQAKEGVDAKEVPLPGKGLPDPLLMIGVKKVVDIDNAYYGEEMAVSEHTAAELCKDVENPKPLNLLAMAAPKIRAPYINNAFETLMDLYHTAAAAFTLAKQDAEQTGKKCHISSGPWGCGSSGNNRALVAIVQIFAAKALNIDLTLYGYLDDDIKLVQSNLGAVTYQLRGVTKSLTIEEVLMSIAEPAV